MYNRMMACAVAICVLWHAVVGCCAHHERCISHSPKSAAPVCGHHCSHRGDDDRDPADSGRQGRAPADCTETSCVMTATAESRVQVAPDDAWAWFVPLAVHTGQSSLHAVGDNVFSSDTGVLRPGPMRTHLALRVLLI